MIKSKKELEFDAELNRHIESGLISPSAIPLKLICKGTDVRVTDAVTGGKVEGVTGYLMNNILGYSVNSTKIDPTTLRIVFVEYDEGEFDIRERLAEVM